MVSKKEVSKEVAKRNAVTDRQERIKAKAEALVTKDQVTKVVTKDVAKNCGVQPVGKDYRQSGIASTQG